jgi:hypothetical protein
MIGADPEARKRARVWRQNKINIQTPKRVTTAILGPRDRGGNLDPKIGSPTTKNHTPKTNNHKNPRDRGGNLGGNILKTQKQTLTPHKIITKYQ